MKINWKFSAILALGIVLLPFPALANVGTPLIWARISHLLLGNAIIGSAEAFLLTKLFHTPKWPSVWLLYAANYLSAWVGAFLLTNRLSSIPSITIENAQIWLWICVPFAFAVTLLIEYPFFWFLLRKQERSITKAIKATLIIHGISYLLLFGWYSLSSQTSMLTQLEVVAAQEIQPQEEYELYFITPDGKQVIRSNLEGKNQKVVKDLEAIERDSKLVVRQDEESRFDLLVDNEVILTNFASLAGDRPQFYEEVTKLTENSDWEYRTIVWAAGGIIGNNQKENSGFQFAIETPFAAWRVSNATHLEGDAVVFQLGDNQVCILQPQEKIIALIARGKEPVVVKPKS
ncbi:MAG: hypothetical protein WBG70_18650 [Spirulinaceae cyanobacterium]